MGMLLLRRLREWSGRLVGGLGISFCSEDLPRCVGTCEVVYSDTRIQVWYILDIW